MRRDQRRVRLLERFRGSLSGSGPFPDGLRNEPTVVLDWPHLRIKTAPPRVGPYKRRVVGISKQGDAAALQFAAVDFNNERGLRRSQGLAHSFQHFELRSVHVDFHEPWRPLVRGERVNARRGGAAANRGRNYGYSWRKRGISPEVPLDCG